MKQPILTVQEIPFEDPESHYMFQPGPGKPFVATPAALSLYCDAVYRCLVELQVLARKKGGQDYFQIFEDPDTPQALWFMEDETAITALLPSDH
jgi:hypothetical protein